MRLSVVGGGSWGTAFAALLATHGIETTLLFRDGAQADAVRAAGENERYLPGVPLPGALTLARIDDDAVIERADVVALVVPSRAFATVCADLAPRLRRDASVLSLTKGLEPGTGRRLSEVAAEATGAGLARVAVLSGPNHAEEVARGVPTATVIAAHDVTFARRLQALCSTPTLRAYANSDVVGVELCAATKNVIALAAGVSDGLGYGDNAKAALITRGLAEMGRLGAAFGADPRTFSGLAGLGDLVATCCSRLSRNRKAGELLARGVAPEHLEREIGMVAEGLTTAPTLERLAASHGLELPITARVCAVLAGESPRDAVERLMARAAAVEY